MRGTGERCSGTPETLPGTFLVASGARSRPDETHPPAADAHQGSRVSCRLHPG